MRTCPVCNSDKREPVRGYEYNYTLYACKCGMRYMDKEDQTQSALDRYYSSNMSPDLCTPETTARLQSLADVLPEGKGLDVGGKWSELAIMHPMDTLNAGETITGEYDYMVVSHTLEHVYTVQPFMQSIREHLRTGGQLFIEIPVWLDVSDTHYDYYWQHLNKFAQKDIERLLKKNGFTVTLSRLLPDFQMFHCWRIIGVKND